METANAFDVLILPMLQWLAGTIAALPILSGIRFGIGRLIGGTARVESRESLR